MEGGAGAPSLGTSYTCGLDIDDAGNLDTDGDVTIKCVISAGPTPQALTNAADLIDGDKIQDGTADTAELADNAVTPTKLDETGDFIVNTLQLNDFYFSGGIFGADTYTDLQGIADNVGVPCADPRPPQHRHRCLLPALCACRSGPMLKTRLTTLSAGATFESSYKLAVGSGPRAKLHRFLSVEYVWGSMRQLDQVTLANRRCCPNIVDPLRRPK